MRLLAVHACTALILSLLGSKLHAHPHVWIECQITAEFDAQGLTGFRQHWVLDEMFSASMLPQFDLDKDRVISAEENMLAKREAFDNLKEYSYFTHVRIDGKPFKVQFVKEFRCTLDAANRLVYEFFVPCTVRATSELKTITLGIYDSSFYCDIGYAEGTPKLAGILTDLIVQSRRVELNDSEAMMYSPQGYEVRFKKK
jgi:ABC-type uncharacterized transport system substrate-binding protein